MTNSATALTILHDLEQSLQTRDDEPSFELAAQIVHAARFVLENPTSLHVVKETSDAMRRARIYFEQHRATLTAVNLLAAEHIRLQWRLGDALLRVPRQQGARPVTSVQGGTLSTDGTRFQQVLNGLNVSRSFAYRWQTLAAHNPQDVELYFAEQEQKEEPITLGGILNYFTQQVVIDPRADGDDETVPSDESEKEYHDEMPMPVFRKVEIACRACGTLDTYEVEI